MADLLLFLLNIGKACPSLYYLVLAEGLMSTALVDVPACFLR
jgi:hypothetical protein